MPARKLSYSQALMLTILAGVCMQASASETTGALDAASRFDQVTVEMPAAGAPIGAVALARINISLRAARNLASNKLCGGNWTPAGQVAEVDGPHLTDKPNGEVWHYRSLRRAPPLACEGVSRAQFFIEMSRHLPAWFNIRPAGYSITFRQGSLEPGSPPSVASR